MKISDKDKELIEKNVYEECKETTYRMVYVEYDENMKTNWLESGGDKHERTFGDSYIVCEICNKKFLKPHIEQIINHLHTEHQL